MPHPGARSFSVVKLACLLLLLWVDAAAAGPAPSVTTGAPSSPIRCVQEYLDAIVAAAPARAASARAPDPAGADPRWAVARAHLAPRALELTSHRPGPLTPWVSLGRGGALVGYELMAVRRAPRGAMVVVARELTQPDRRAEPSTAACAYLVAPVNGSWRIADKRCGRDFANGEVASGYPGFWDDPGRDPTLWYADDPFEGELE